MCLANWGGEYGTDLGITHVQPSSSAGIGDRSDELCHRAMPDARIHVQFSAVSGAGSVTGLAESFRQRRFVWRFVTGNWSYCVQRPFDFFSVGIDLAPQSQVDQ